MFDSGETLLGEIRCQSLAGVKGVKYIYKTVKIINNVPLRDHSTPHYVNLGLIKLPDIIKLSTSLLFYDHIVDKQNHLILHFLLYLRSTIMPPEVHLCST